MAPAADLVCAREPAPAAAVPRREVDFSRPRVCLLGGVRIGCHAVICANSVVLCTVPPYAAAVAIPARILARCEPAWPASAAPA
jgi:hypothetical protein